MEIIIRDDIRDLIPPLADDEREQLERNIKRDGCREPLVVWDRLAPPSDTYCKECMCDIEPQVGDGIWECPKCGFGVDVWEEELVLLDGHHRLAICDTHNIPYKTTKLEFDDTGAAKVWVIDNQFGRRNLKPYQRFELTFEREKYLPSRQGERTDLQDTSLSNDNKVRPVDNAAKQAGMSVAHYERAKHIHKHADEETKEKLRAGDATIGGVYKDVKKEERRKDRHERKNTIPDDLPDHGDRWQLHTCDILDAPIEDNSLSWIITDPPYAKEHLEVWNKLGLFASTALKRGGSLIAMAPQSYLPEIIELLGTYTDGWNMKYQWTLAYLTPGGQSAQLWDRKVNTFWKPLLWFKQGEYSGDWIGDVCNSTENDKQHHKWGQSVGGMAAIIERFTVPGDLICDPFCGAGTTGVAAIKMNRLFVGVDIDGGAIEKTKARLVDV